MDNTHPTECLNKILRENNLTEWRREHLIAKFLNQFDIYYNMINTNLNQFIEEFQNNWLHK